MADFERYDAQVVGISVDSKSVRPPRAMTFDGSEIGRIIGRAGDRAFHKKVVHAALEMFTHDTPPGKVVRKVIR